MKVRLVAALTGAALVVAVSGCGSAGPTRTGNGTTKGITIWAVTGSYNAVYQNSAAAFQKSTGQKAEVQLFQSDAYKQKIRVSLGADNPPEVFENWGGGGLADLVKSGLVQDLTGLLAGNPDVKNRFIPSLLEAATYNGKVYGLPMNGISPAVVFYNKKIFSRYGLNPPTTVDELLTVAAALRSHGITPFALGGAQKWPQLMFEEYLVDRIGGAAVVDAILTGKPGAWSDPAVIQANTQIKKLLDAHAFGRDFAATSYDTGQATALLYTGKAAMELMGAWEYAGIKKAAPDFVAGGSLGWSAFPQVTGGKGDPSSLEGNPANYYSVATRSANPTGGAAFLKDSVMTASYVDDLISNGRTPPVPGIEARLAATKDGAWTGYVYHLAATAAHYTLSWDQALPPAAADSLLTNLADLFLGKLSPEQFSAAMTRATA
jgi:raffinose/stachyose/melibiose transport system substrate-binding protein